MSSRDKFEQAIKARFGDLIDYLADGCDGHVWDTSYAEPGDVLLYTTPITPISPDKMTVEMAYPRVQTNWHDAKNFAEGWNACLAAMLHAGNHTEQHLDMVVHSGDDNEKADCRLPFDQWLSQQNEPIDVDCGCVTTEAFYHWLRVAYEAGNSPVTPDGWQLVPKEPTEAMNKAGWAAINEHDAINPTYRAMLAAAPQQDVRLALEIGMSRYAGAMQKLVDSGD
ncbi:hypothetical protein ACTJN2_00410 [Citrobacter freundii]|uniref:hypothetical protein n=1 Tax=Citrobacter freundii TaxID=546 RepID=UPI001FFE09FE|nr:hypothetical protein [Citrobacter freundii]MDE9643122.1 hypothetical protein [Citrobacter freundii]MDE9695707.1 hypothetical protein [Citrobacter freundii]MDE9697428.1 hypothetical protein [Citrobacter freundii]MEB0808118.1 hypothetical protein [Citrobacter freundii]